MIAPLRALAGAALFLLPAIGLLPGEGRAQGAAPGNVQFHEVQIAADAFSLGEAVPAWVIPTAIPEPGQAEPMLIRLADTQYYVDRAPIVYVRRAMTINDAASLSRAGQVSIPFVPQYHKLKVHAVRVLRGGETLDRTASSSVRFLQRETGLEQGIYSGEVTASILVNDLRVGDTLEYAYSLYGQNPVFGDKFIATASWDQGYPAALRRVVLTHPAGRHIAWRLIGDRKDAPLTPAESVREGMRRLVFEERSIAKVLLEPMTPTEHVAFRRLQFSEFAGWSDVVGWADELFQSNGNLGEDGRAMVETLRQKATEEDRVVAALEFVQSQIRYFSVSMGESSHRPTQPEVVLKRRYGDCKDKSLLLVTLLQALGIPAKPVLVDLGRLRGLDSELPSPELFNHAIVQATVGGQVFYLDPTALGQHGRLRRMGQIHEGAQVLVVSPQARELSIVASPDVKELVRSVVSETATIHKFNADGELKSKQTWHGVVAERLRVMQERLPREQLLKSIADAMESRYPGAKLVGEPDIQDDRVNNALSIAATYRCPSSRPSAMGTGSCGSCPPTCAARWWRRLRRRGRRLSSCSISPTRRATPSRSNFPTTSASSPTRARRASTTSISAIRSPRPSAAILPSLGRAQNARRPGGGRRPAKIRRGRARRRQPRIRGHRRAEARHQGRGVGEGGQEGLCANGARAGAGNRQQDQCRPSSRASSPAPTLPARIACAAPRIPIWAFRTRRSPTPTRP